MERLYPTDPIDAHVGERLRLARTMRGLSQGYLGGYVGVSFQQIQKYEKAANRISASMLARFSYLLGVPLTFFYEGLPPAYLKSEKPVTPDISANVNDNILGDDETQKFISAFYAVKSSRYRSAIMDILLAIADKQPPTAPTRSAE